MAAHAPLRFIAVWRWQLVDPVSYPLVVLERGRPWDDHGYRTLFHLYYWIPGADEPEPIGPVKILQRGVHRTQIDEGEFPGLSDEYCSLGQDLTYYENIQARGQDVAHAIAAGLRDIVWHPDIHAAMEGEEGLSRSLLRWRSAKRAFTEARRILESPERVPEPVAARFTFRCELKGFSAPHEVEFAFFPEDGTLGRLMCLVGKNATGKTNFLRSLASVISGLDESLGRVSEARLPLSQVIVIAYSAFDRYRYYKRGRPQDALAYHYCGLRNGDGAIDVEHAYQVMERRLRQIRSDENHQKWREVMRRAGLLETESHLPDPFADEDYADFVQQVRDLSAGHKLLLLALTGLTATIRENSLIILDEPELHLHPALLARLMRLLHAVLDEFHSFAVVATHSPQVLQEVPARSIRILERFDDAPLVRTYPRESFGANLDEITEFAFGVDESDKNYAALLRENASELGTEWVARSANQVFKSGLGLAPRALLHNLQTDDPPDEEA